MKKLLSTHLPTAYSLAAIAREILIDTHNAATTKVCDLRSQVDELWRAADDMLPRKRTTEAIRRVENALRALRNRDTIEFPKGLKT